MTKGVEQIFFSLMVVPQSATLALLNLVVLIRAGAGKLLITVHVLLVSTIELDVSQNLYFNSLKVLRLKVFLI